ncbi:MAG: rhomboid family intramembrane serine protease [Acidobacteriota bacterium]
MAIGTRSYASPYASRSGLPTGVKWLLIANTVVWLLQQLPIAFLNNFLSYLQLVPQEVVRFAIWQLVTYMFLHGGILHILFNMLTLWMFGREIEETWGTRRFLNYYFICGIGAGICIVLFNYLLPHGQPGGATIGASGAIYGLLLASAVLWPDRIIYFNFLFPIKMKWLVILYGALAFYSSFDASSGVSNIGHLGGLLVGLVYLKTPRMRRFDPLSLLRQQYRDWKLARAKRKFQVYLKKQGSDRGPWVN